MPGKAICMASIKCKKPLGWPGLRPDPAWKVYRAHPDSLADGEGAGCPLLKKPTPLLAFQASPVPAP